MRCTGGETFTPDFCSTAAHAAGALPTPSLSSEVPLEAQDQANPSGTGQAWESEQGQSCSPVVAPGWQGVRQIPNTGASEEPRLRESALGPRALPLRAGASLCLARSRAPCQLSEAGPLQRSLHCGVRVPGGAGSGPGWSSGPRSPAAGPVLGGRNGHWPGTEALAWPRSPLPLCAQSLGSARLQVKFAHLWFLLRKMLSSGENKSPSPSGHVWALFQDPELTFAGPHHRPGPTLTRGHGVAVRAHPPTLCWVEMSPRFEQQKAGHQESCLGTHLRQPPWAWFLLPRG